MKRRYSVFILLLAFAFSCQEKPNEEVSQWIENYRAEIAPDKRVALWNLEFENDSLKGETDQIEGLANLLAQLNKEGISYVNAVKQLPDAALGEKTKALVTISVANIRSNPKHSAELATQALMGTPLNVLKEDGGWFLVQTPDGYISWVDRAGIELLTPEELETWHSKQKIVFTELNGHVWSTLEQNEMVSDVVAGDIMNLEKIDGEFVHVSLPDSRKGFIPAESSMSLEDWLASRSTSPEKLISTAKQMLGVPYLWGGTSIKGVDCSGFTKTIYYLNGQVIPRDASQQVNEGEEVDIDKNWENLEVGDLLFFGEKATEDKKERVVHVGMWIGNNEFIHSRGRVRISSFDPNSPNFDEYELNRYLRTKRIINHPSDGVISVSELLTNE
ncbi:C40 family peptidase [Algoriphagus aestuarii]|nr:C40 family peptidase [Algoriphagus aestuarii]